MPYANRLLTRHHAGIIPGGALALWDASGRRHVLGEHAANRILIHEDPSLTRSDRAEVIATVMGLAPEVDLADPRFIQFLDVVLDVTTGDTLEPSPELVIPNVIPHAWNPAAHDARVEEFLGSISCGCESTLALIEEMLGAAVYRGRIPYIWVVVGVAPVEGGDASNGKSTLCAIAVKLVGRENSAELDVHDLGRNFMTASLLGALLDVSSDTSSAPIPPSALSILKRIPTQDVLMADVKYAQPVRFRPYATMVIAANRVPGFVVDAGLKRRTRVIPLRGHFEEGGADPAVELDNEECMSALAVHAVAGLRRLLGQGPTASEDGEASLGSLVALSSSVAQWVDDRDVSAKWLEGRACSATYRGYADWCADAGTQALPKGEFERELPSVVPGVSVRKCRHKGSAPTRRWMPAS